MTSESIPNPVLLKHDQALSEQQPQGTLQGPVPWDTSASGGSPGGQLHSGHLAIQRAPLASRTPRCNR